MPTIVHGSYGGGTDTSNVTATPSDVLQTKNQIKQAIVDKGVDVAESDTFRSYANKVSSIKTPQGNAAPGDVRSGKTFSNSTGTNLVGTFVPTIINPNLLESVEVSMFREWNKGTEFSIDDSTSYLSITDRWTITESYCYRGSTITNRDPDGNLCLALLSGGMSDLDIIISPSQTFSPNSQYAVSMLCYDTWPDGSNGTSSIKSQVLRSDNNGQLGISINGIGGGGMRYIYWIKIESGPDVTPFVYDQAVVGFIDGVG